MELRDYQKKLISEINNSWNLGFKNVLMQLHTGGGKTVILSEVIKNHAGHSIVIAHRNQLVAQVSLTLARFGIYHNLIANSQVRKEIVQIHQMKLGRFFYNPNAYVTVASVDTLIKLPMSTDWFKKISLLIIDEAHHVLKSNKWGKACNLFPNAKGLYPTATPLRADGKGLGRHHDGVVDTIVEGPPMRQLIDTNYLTDYRIFAPPSDLNLTDVTITTSGDYSPEKLRTAVHKSHITGDIVDHYLKIAPGKTGVTFAVDLKAAADIVLKFRQAGIPAEVISADVPEITRQHIFRKFENKEILQIVNVDILGEGVDIPAIEVVSFGRPTESYSVYAQQFGRALRPLEGKQHALIIDHVNNVIRHGLPDGFRIWSLDRKDKRGKSQPNIIDPVKSCLKCFSVYFKYIKSCPYCGHYQEPQSRREPHFVDGDLCELTEETLISMRQQSLKIFEAPKIPYNATPAIRGALEKRHKERQDSQLQLRDSISQWAGIYHHKGASDSEIYRRFYFTFGIDILSAQALAKQETNLLYSRIIDDMDKIL